MDRKSLVLLLSSGRHPVSGRARAADCDARAVRLALDLWQQGCTVTALHAGRPDDAALADYLGMGLPEITVLGPLDDMEDAVPVLAEAAAGRAPALVLCGQRAETGEGSGMVPYLVAEALGLPVVADVAGVRLDGPGLKVLRAEPAGRRRQYSLDGGGVLAVGAFAPPPLPFAYGRMRRGSVVLQAMQAPPDRERAQWTLQPARMRPNRLDAANAGTDSGGNQALAGLTPDQAAERIMQFLAEIKVLNDAAPERRAE